MYELELSSKHVYNFPRTISHQNNDYRSTTGKKYDPMQLGQIIRLAFPLPREKWKLKTCSIVCHHLLS